ncbi:MAG: hypothetical protein JSW26_00350 [Desulfobacterales bacterium]|nr:MAG: hypothetical protein JSW26_00350 [Desulfobacterales bacterium]
MAETAEVKPNVAGRLVNKVSAAGVPIDILYIDPLLYPLAANMKPALATLEAIEQIMKELPGVHTAFG